MIGSFESPFELGILNSSMASYQLMLQGRWPTCFSTLRHVKVKGFTARFHASKQKNWHWLRRLIVRGQFLSIENSGKAVAYQPNSSTSSTLTTAAPSSGQSARETSGTCDSPRSRTYATPPPPPTLDRGDREAKEEKDSVARTPTQAVRDTLFGMISRR